MCTIAGTVSFHTAAYLETLLIRQGCYVLMLCVCFAKGCCYFLVDFEWLLLFLSGLWMDDIISW